VNGSKALFACPHGVSSVPCDVCSAKNPRVAPRPLRTDAERKSIPVTTGAYDYFPDALWEVAHLSWAGNEKHNPGESLHDARAKSTDDADCLLRHFRDRGTWDEIKTKDGRTIRVRHSACVAWRALRILQKECEADGAPLAKGAIL
jgi:hypothetical protein